MLYLCVSFSLLSHSLSSRFPSPSPPPVTTLHPRLPLLSYPPSFVAHPPASSYPTLFLPPPAIPCPRPLESKRDIPIPETNILRRCLRTMGETGKIALGLYEFRSKLVQQDYRRDPRKRYDAGRTIVKSGKECDRPRHKLY